MAFASAFPLKSSSKRKKCTCQEENSTVFISFSFYFDWISWNKQFLSVVKPSFEIQSTIILVSSKIQNVHKTCTFRFSKVKREWTKKKPKPQEHLQNIDILSHETSFTLKSHENQFQFHTIDVWNVWKNVHVHVHECVCCGERTQLNHKSIKWTIEHFLIIQLKSILYIVDFFAS